MVAEKLLRAKDALLEAAKERGPRLDDVDMQVLAAHVAIMKAFRALSDEEKKKEAA